MTDLHDLVVALDLGGTKFRVALVNRDGDILKRSIAATDAHEGRKQVLQRVNDLIHETMRETGATIIGMGISVPGPLDPEKGIIMHPPNLPNWEHVPIRDLCEKEFGIPVYAGNDANMAAVGEHRYGAGKGVSHLVYITVSTGIGGGVIINNKLYLGSRGLAGEVGHMTVDPDGPLCNCGNSGCLEALASGTSIARRAAERIAAGEMSSLASLVKEDPRRLTAEAVELAGRSGDTLAKAVLEEAGRYLGMGVANLIHCFDPEMVVIGGGVSRAGDAIISPVRREVEKRLMPAFKDSVAIVPAVLGENTGLLGAATMAFGQAGAI